MLDANEIVLRDIQLSRAARRMHRAVGTLAFIGLGAMAGGVVGGVMLIHAGHIAGGVVTILSGCGQLIAGVVAWAVTQEVPR